MKIFGGAFYACKRLKDPFCSTIHDVKAFTVVASSKQEAQQSVMPKALKHFPISEGWEGHDIAIAESTKEQVHIVYLETFKR
jgi:hypothetical protein